MSINQFERIVDVFTLDNKPVLVATAVACLVGLFQYFICIRVFIKEGKTPLPFWMHSFYLAHDSTWCYLARQAASRHDNHWYLSAFSNGLGFWSMMEIWCIYKIIMEDRKGTFSAFFGPSPPLSSVLGYTIAQVSSMYAIIFLGIILMGDDCMLQWNCLTNVVMVVGPTHEYLRRGSRKGLPVSFCLLCVVGTLWTFAPFGMWVLIIPEMFDRPAFYAAGAILQIYSIWCFQIVYRYPSKTKKV
ncbi:hypothetical protein FB567DRAFT_531830 [Paraphoma chrysanthemicola]|uniref:Uncharacterized protein n=1 Tax=Paraphoma chrysanthemicola TaxID=798071 RepID=A0A8K0QZV9_9PLEO|nr:hypothetical protein FB567DRAFT_531830 [Paraphoma chrysanthemicola]